MSSSIVWVGWCGGWVGKEAVLSQSGGPEEALCWASAHFLESSCSLSIRPRALSLAYSPPLPLSPPAPLWRSISMSPADDGFPNSMPALTGECAIGSTQASSSPSKEVVVGAAVGGSLGGLLLIAAVVIGVLRCRGAGAKAAEAESVSAVTEDPVTQAAA